RGVVLLLGLRLERAAFARDEQPLEGAIRNGQASVEPENTRLVEGLARRVVLLPVGVTGPRVRRPDDPGLGPVDARLPRGAGLDEAAVLELEGILAHVPDVALPVLRIPVVGSLDRVAVLGDGVAH